MTYHFKNLTNNNFIKNEIQKDSIFIIGRVFSVSGRDIIIEIDKNKNLPHLFYNGKTVRNVAVGLSNYVKIMKGFTEIICKVEGEYLEYDKTFLNKDHTSEKQKIKRKIKVVVFGFYDDDKKFQHGIKEMPLIDNECRLLSKEEFEKLHQLAKNDELYINIGKLVDEVTQEIKLPVKELFAGHIGIFGNTGSGKSNTLAKMYYELFNQEIDFKEKSNFLFIDFNGEYCEADCLTIQKDTFNLNTKNKGDKIFLNISKLKELEILSILLDATEKTQKPFLHRAIDKNWIDNNNENCFKEIESIVKKINEIFNKNDIHFNHPFLKEYVRNLAEIGFLLIKSNKNIDDFLFNVNSRSFYIRVNNVDCYHNDNPSGNQINIINIYFEIKVTDSYKKNELNKFKFKILDQYYFEILNGYSNDEHIRPLIGRLHKRFNMIEKVFSFDKSNDIEKEIKIINLKNVNLEVKKIIPLIICKYYYDEQKEKRDSNEDNSLHIIIDEAHNILSESSTREAESWKDYRLETFEEIIKEGRKFGVFLTISSQRPSDISPTIISQLHNYFIHRLMNDNDLKAINKAVSYLDKLSFDSISNLSVGSSFIAGQVTQFPLSVKIDLLDKDKQPKSETINLNKLWNKNINQ